ncbi:MAG: nudL [Burkholderiaceae bacterium]|nr:nudL [Burkholderiaceae bacterium]
MIPIFNPREVPHIAWSEHIQMPAWTEQNWQLLNRALIQNALMQAHDVPDLWRQDISLSENVRYAAVLVLLIEREQGYDVVLTTRAAHLRHHAGQVSFVGGRIEVGESALQAALREANEEIGLNRQDVTVLGVMPDYQTITGFCVTPVVAVITDILWQKQIIQIDEQEVDQMFTVPLRNLLDRAQMRVHTFEYAEQTRRFLSVTHDEFFIWGASMAMLHNFDLILRAGFK